VGLQQVHVTLRKPKAVAVRRRTQVIGPSTVRHAARAVRMDRAEGALRLVIALVLLVTLRGASTGRRQAFARAGGASQKIEHVDGVVSRHTVTVVQRPCRTGCD
jgi:hypothetical protein